MKALELRIPPLAVVAVIAVMMWVAYRFLPEAGFALPFRRLLLAIVLPAAVLIAGFAIRSFRIAQTTVNPSDPNEAEKLVTTGLFRFSRNPMYLALTLLLLAYATYLQNVLSFVLVALFPFYITRFQIQPEERILAEKFGAAYENYRMSVRRWI